jgi:anti-sigma regulatory factor (Ser/Thr protein kinase)
MVTALTGGQCSARRPVTGSGVARYPQRVGLQPGGTAFRHEAFFYTGGEQFLEGTSAFLREGVEAGEPALAVLAAPKIEALRSALGDRSEAVHFADMAEVGSNPGRIIGEWREFADANAGRSIRGIGEPIWPERTPAELVECQRHESLLNLAFAERSAFQLMCPYDTGALSGEVLAEARRSHPLLNLDGARRESDCCRSLDEVAAPFAEPLPDPPPGFAWQVFQRATLAALRHFVARQVRAADFPARAAEDLTLAVSEVATNTVLHGGGGGILRIWREEDALVCEVTDRGRIDAPLVGRERPPSPGGGHGLWLANQVCDLVQIRSFAGGSVVRLHKRPRESAAGGS